MIQEENKEIIKFYTFYALYTCIVFWMEIVIIDTAMNSLNARNFLFKHF